MRIIEVSGTFREIGRATGEALREEIQAHVAMRGPLKPEQLPALQRQGEVLDAQLPYLYEELYSTAEGANVPLVELAAINLPVQYDHTLDEGDGCTNIGFAGGPDGPLLGKNNDGTSADLDKQWPVCIRKVTPNQGIPFLTMTFAGWLGLGDGLNAEGLAMGHSSVGSTFQQSHRYVPVRLWSHWGLLTRSTTKAFIRHMADRPTCGKGYAWVVVDRSGEAVSLEVPCPMTQVRRSSRPDGHLHCVNCYQLPPLAQADRRSPEGKRLALARKDMLDKRLDEAAPYGLEQMKALLRHHGSPSVCRHGGEDLSHTEYSLIAQPQAGRLLYRHGKPCEGRYEEVTV